MLSVPSNGLCVPTHCPHTRLMKTSPTLGRYSLLVRTSQQRRSVCLTPSTLRPCPHISFQAATSVTLLATINGNSLGKKLFHPYLTCHPTPLPLCLSSLFRTVIGSHWLEEIDETAAVNNTNKKTPRKIAGIATGTQKNTFTKKKTKWLKPNNLTVLLMKMGEEHKHTLLDGPLLDSFLGKPHPRTVINRVSAFPPRDYCINYSPLPPRTSFVDHLLSFSSPRTPLNDHVSEQSHQELFPTITFNNHFLSLVAEICSFLISFRDFPQMMSFLFFARAPPFRLGSSSYSLCPSSHEM